jgi:hypothetical protein
MDGCYTGEETVIINVMFVKDLVKRKQERGGDQRAPRVLFCLSAGVSITPASVSRRETLVEDRLTLPRAGRGRLGRGAS